MKKNFKVNTKDINSGGTHLQGYINITHAELKKVLGKSNGASGDGKVKAEWDIQGTVDGETVVATIYDWKESIGVTKVTNWHIGGHNPKSLALIKQIFPKAVVN